MRAAGVYFALIVSTAAFAQYHGPANPTPVFHGTFGNVVFPGGTASTPGVQRFFPNVVFPAGNAPRLYVPYSAQDPTRVSAQFGRPYTGGNGGGRRDHGTRAVAVPYAVPIYVGGYAGYTGYYDGGAPTDAGPAAAPPAGQPNVIVVYPSVVPGSAPLPASGGYAETTAPPPPPAPEQEPAASSTPGASYLIAFRDHTIYSAVAYWVEGETLHYFTSGATHNQVSLSLVDRDLTQRLNAEAGNNLQLPTN